MPGFFVKNIPASPTPTPRRSNGRPLNKLRSQLMYESMEIMVKIKKKRRENTHTHITRYCITTLVSKYSDGFMSRCCEFVLYYIDLQKIYTYAEGR